ncbi:hypothetical protein PGT21_028415 [Puccinia graminis f. sp. tritici]|uniref:Uncharacterized protein n=1 Tax=Puccinia graminis f. sp. tritici TaxID=56615 RepID=A0A5B0QXW0_PUCGR|nr:hypothetical protein PGT21_028415 [Puccinia graminis f. sp. tritici]
MSEPKHQIPDLSKTNFGAWKQKVIGYCQQLGLRKYLTLKVAPTDAAALEVYQTNRSKTAGILVSNMGITNYNRFVTEKNDEDPQALWKLLTDYFEAKTPGNQARVYNDFCTFKYKGSDLTAYLELIDQHLKLMASVGIKMEGPD